MSNVYPAGNPGIFPLDPTTPTGQFRIRSGDMLSVPFVPAQAGFQDYTSYSDAEITAYIAAANNSISRGIGYAYMQAAGLASAESKKVKDYDLQVDLTTRANDLRATALAFFAMALTEDKITGINDYFDVIEPPTIFSIAEGETQPYFDYGQFFDPANWWL